jgi:hypothetical protein
MQNLAPPDPSNRRRSTRVLVRIPLKLTGSDGNGNSFEMSAETLMVNKHGARVRTPLPLTLGMELVVAVPASGRSQAAHVVWQHEDGLNQYGLALTSPENLWGITFPPEDWEAEVHAARL